MALKSAGVPGLPYPPPVAQIFRIYYPDPMAGLFQKNRLKKAGFRIALLGCLLILAALWGTGSVFAHPDHDCTGELCPVCIRTEDTRQLFKAMLLLLAAVVSLALPGTEADRDIKKTKDHRSPLFSPVTLKAKLSS